MINIATQISAAEQSIKPIKYKKLLGDLIQDDLEWSDYIQNYDRNLELLALNPDSWLELVSSWVNLYFKSVSGEMQKIICLITSSAK